MKNSNKFKHLTKSDRSFIESYLATFTSFKDIADALAKDASTIAKEIKRNSIIKHPSAFGKNINVCSKKQDCNFGKLCSIRSVCNSSCTSCKKCNELCSNYSYLECPVLLKPPYVCNPCASKSHCKKIKRVYSASSAHDSYLDLLSTSRTGINISLEEFEKIDNLVSTLVKESNLSINHIINTNKDEISLSARTIYRYFDNNILLASSLDLPRKLKFKPRKKTKEESNINFEYLDGRRYSDFQKYLLEHPEQEVIELDCVEGTKGSAVFLTMLFRNSSLMLVYKLDKHDANSVNNVLRNLMKQVGKTRFKKYFPIILTDRGHEFRRLSQLEFDNKNNRITRIFYCDPNCSYQKGKLEQNHTILRKVYPKSKCLDSVSEEDTINLMNNINNYARESLGFKTPLEVFSEDKPVKFVLALKQKKIASNKVCLKAKF